MSFYTEWMIEYNIEDGVPGWDVFFNGRVVEYGLPELFDALDLVRMRSGEGQSVLVVDEEDHEETVWS